MVTRSAATPSLYIFTERDTGDVAPSTDIAAVVVRRTPGGPDGALWVNERNVTPEQCAAVERWACGRIEAGDPLNFLYADELGDIDA